MSALADCPGCSQGDHSQHRAGWNVRPGVLGGSSCNCSGDCAQRHDAATERLLYAIFGVQMPDDDPN